MRGRKKWGAFSARENVLHEEEDWNGEQVSDPRIKNGHEEKA